MSNRLLVNIALAGIFTLVAGLPPAAAQSLRLAHHHAVGSTIDLTANKFAELVNARSKGTLTVKVFPAAQLGQEREAYGLCNTAVIDLCITSLGIVDQAYPPINVTSRVFPFNFRSRLCTEVVSGEILVSSSRMTREGCMPCFLPVM